VGRLEQAVTSSLYYTEMSQYIQEKHGIDAARLNKMKLSD